MANRAARLGAASVAAALLTATGYLALRDRDAIEINLGPSAKEGLVRVFDAHTKFTLENGYVVRGNIEETYQPKGVPIADFEKKIHTDMNAIIREFDELRAQVSPGAFADDQGVVPHDFFQDFVADVPDANTLLNDPKAMSDFSGRVARLGTALWYSADTKRGDTDAEVVKFHHLADVATGLSDRLSEVERRDAIRDFIVKPVQPVEAEQPSNGF